jgi:dTDP-4-dehydrorhamnose reductase
MDITSADFLLIGGSGMLGQTFRERFDSLGIRYHSPSSQDLNITDATSVEKFFENHNFKYVINCSAYTKVDLAEKERDICHNVNVIGSKNLAIQCNKNQVKLISFSTDYVYSGTSKIPYTEAESGETVNYYGQSKFDGEKEIISHCPNHLILRISWLYSKKYGNNFYKTMVRLGAEKKEISVVSDQIGCPTTCDEVVEITIQALQKNLTGIYNFSGNQEMSWADFASQIMKENNLRCDVRSISTDQYPTPAKRPTYSVMNQTKLKKDLNIQKK